MSLRRIKDVLWVLALFGFVAAVLRLAMGLGATTGLSDSVPWGLWKVLNMIAGVALATGGFVLAFSVHVLRIKVLKPLLRPALLLAFLGYASSCVALLLDIGLPHRFWHPIFYWNIHSFLFEVFWCVLLYFTVTVLEVAPIALENSRFSKAKRILKKIATPVVILGITFSTMHHTTLGSLFLVSPDRVHELWYSSWLPIFFILSAVGAGMFAVVLLTLIITKLYHREAPMPALKRAATAAAVVLSVYFVARIGDLAARGSLQSAVSGLWEGKLFIVEMLFAVVVPVGLVLAPRTRGSPAGLTAAALFAVAGLAMNRLDVGIFAYFRSSGVGYSPTLPELCLTVGIPAAAGIFFLFFVEKFRVFELGRPLSESVERRRVTDFDPQTRVWSRAFLGNLERVSLMVLIVVPLALALFLPAATAAEKDLVPVQAAMGADKNRTVLRIDGDRDGDFVLFPHDAHKESMGGEDSCMKCHHLDRPGDQAASCSGCHSDMWKTTSIFHHGRHVEHVAAREGHSGRLAGNRSCVVCHVEGKARNRENSKDCRECHAEDMRMEERTSDLAMGYAEALHRNCVKCHEEHAKEAERPHLGECETCHEKTYASLNDPD